MFIVRKNVFVAFFFSLRKTFDNTWEQGSGEGVKLNNNKRKVDSKCLHNALKEAYIHTQGKKLQLIDKLKTNGNVDENEHFET